MMLSQVSYEGGAPRSHFRSPQFRSVDLLENVLPSKFQMQCSKRDDPRNAGVVQILQTQVACGGDDAAHSALLGNVVYELTMAIWSVAVQVVEVGAKVVILGVRYTKQSVKNRYHSGLGASFPPILLWHPTELSNSLIDQP